MINNLLHKSSFFGNLRFRKNAKNRKAFFPYLPKRGVEVEGNVQHAEFVGCLSPGAGGHRPEFGLYNLSVPKYPHRRHFPWGVSSTDRQGLEFRMRPPQLGTSCRGPLKELDTCPCHRGLLNLSPLFGGEHNCQSSP